MINCYDSPDIPLGMGCHQCAWLSKKKMNVVNMPTKDDIFDMIQSAFKPLEVKRGGKKL